MRLALAPFAFALSALAAGPTLAVAADPPVTAAGTEAPDAAEINAARQRGIDFLRTTQNDDGGWSSKESLGISAIVAVSLLDSGLAADSPTIAKALDYLEANVREDGGIYSEGSTHRNYETALALMALSRVEGDEYAKPIAGARAFLKGLQWDEGEGIESDDPRWGGAGYGSGGDRPDLSNTQFLVEALKASGSGPEDEAIQKALVFVTRTQNLEGHGNDTPNAAKINDGGFYYTPALGGQTKAGTTANGGLRSYASMTYAGLKSMIYAGLTKNDPRVKAARDWAAKHYTLAENPGMGLQGHYYYLQAFGKTMSVLGEDTLTDADGVTHDWRADLAAQLLSMQRENGSWVNEADRWYEGDPNMVTAYALMALADAAPVKTAAAATK
ncbi:prenyltransferase/squalene oxidase repeat-containing protein [Alienimonas californiensis]|uniref:Prenyltransferase and squalene oxidase repeat protein n=1 Tax=Alienimonas californiensis TaxID=2527989 RepID=A0A517P8C1_9PLAN|nr:prenyltransferase/squalene oxidase repeat-containing protein [Alienimonas californiensis]QDT15595.1 Prenyltransferase and squalene oxidase repeat protein [Alienimonas californiensis]